MYQEDYISLTDIARHRNKLSTFPPLAGSRKR